MNKKYRTNAQYKTKETRYGDGVVISYTGYFPSEPMQFGESIEWICHYDCKK